MTLTLGTAGGGLLPYVVLESLVETVLLLLCSRINGAVNGSEHPTENYYCFGKADEVLCFSVDGFA